MMSFCGDYMHLVKIGRAAQHYGVTPEMLRRWEQEGKLSPTKISNGGTRWYEIDEARPPRIAYDFPLYNDRWAYLDFPRDLTKAEVRKLSSFLSTLVIED